MRSTRRVRWRAVVGSSVALVLVVTVVFPLLYAVVMPEARGPVSTMPPLPNGSYRMYVVDWGYHTAIVLPQPPGWALGPPGKERAAFLEFAWGDKRFYMESDYRPWAVFATLVLPTASVLYLDGRAGPASFVGARAVYSRSIDGETLHALLGELESEIQHGAGGERLGPYAGHEGYAGRFYPAYGRYLWTRDCNWWTVERLRAVGAAGSSMGVVFSGQVFGRLSNFVAAANR